MRCQSHAPSTLRIQAHEVGELVPGIGSGLICHGAVLKAAGLAISVGFFLLLYKVTAPCKGGHCLELNAFIGFFLKGNTNNGSRRASSLLSSLQKGVQRKPRRSDDRQEGHHPSFPWMGLRTYFLNFFSLSLYLFFP